MTLLRSTFAPLLIASVALSACGDAGEEQAGLDVNDTASLCREVKALSLTAQRDSFSFSFAQADQKFSKLIALYDTEDVANRCPSAPTRSFLLASQGLALSNQEQFRLAEAAFKGAQASLDAQESPRADERLMLENFRAQDALNRRSRADTDEAFEAFDRVRQSASTQSVSSLAADDLFAPDDAALRTLVTEASNSYARSIDISANIDPDASEGIKSARLAESEAAIDRAINLIGTVPSASAAYLPRFQIQKAIVQLERKQPGLARVNAAQAAERLNELLPGTPLGARALLVQAKAEADDGDRSAALETYERAFSVYEENPVPIRSASVWPFFRLALEERRANPSIEQKLNAAMFRAAQIVRSSVAAKTISGAAALFSEGDSEAARAVRRWQAANDRYGILKAAQVQAQFDTLASAEAISGLGREVSEAERALEVALRERDELAPSYRATLDAPISLTDVQNVLGEGEALVQILTGDPRNVVFLVQRDSINVYPIGVTAGVTEEVVSILREFVTVESSGEFQEYAADSAYQAYLLLLGEDVGPQLRGFDRLIFSVSGPLASLPLEMLVVEAPDSAPNAPWRTGDYTDIAWLGAQADVSYVPSPRNLVDIRARAGVSSASKPVLAFGDFNPGADASSLLDRYGLDDTCRDDANAVVSLEPLPETSSEVRMIAASLGTPDAVRLGPQFTKDAFDAERGNLADYRIVHFATHGLLWPTPDCFSEPALALSVSPGTDGDPLLTTSDIRGLTLDAQLVVLSACETAGPADRGNVGADGDSLSGLARAFFAAGARAVMASHWAVFSEQTQELTVAMYDEIGKSNANFSTALRSAQQKLRSNPKTSHPIYWAAFVVIGDGSLSLN